VLAEAGEGICIDFSGDGERNERSIVLTLGWGCGPVCREDCPLGA
jgi:hypothetical protein